MTRQIPLFKTLEIETSAQCNRKCPGCLRNSIPDKESTSSWFKDNLLLDDTFKRILYEARQMGFNGNVCLSHYNEPLLDPRIVDLARYTKQMGFVHVFMGSNADFLTEDLARELDGSIDEIGFALYMLEPKLSERASWIKSLFKKTHVTANYGDHMITHFSPLDDHEALAAAHCKNRCMHPFKRMVVNHRGDMLLCCDDLTGHFDLGSVYTNSLEELWYSEKHQELVLALSQPGGRAIHPHCLSCPRA